MDGGVGSGMVFGRDNGAVDVGRVEGENALDASRIVHKMDGCSIRQCGRFRFAMNALLLFREPGW